MAAAHLTLTQVCLANQLLLQTMAPTRSSSLSEFSLSPYQNALPWVLSVCPDTLHPRPALSPLT